MCDNVFQSIDGTPVSTVWSATAFNNGNGGSSGKVKRTITSVSIDSCVFDDSDTGTQASSSVSIEEPHRVVGVTDPNLWARFFTHPTSVTLFITGFTYVSVVL